MLCEGRSGSFYLPAPGAGKSIHNELRKPDRDPGGDSSPIESQRALPEATALFEALKRLSPDVKAAIVALLEAVVASDMCKAGDLQPP